MKKKEYISPVFTVVNVNSKRYFLLGSGGSSKKVSVKYKPNSDPLENIDVEDDGGDLD